jgi:hypothetical protein
VVVVVKVLVWSAAITDMAVVVEVLVIDVLVDVEIIVVGVIVIVLKFVLPVSYSVNVTSGVVFDLFADGLTGVMLSVLPGIGIEVLAGVNTNAFPVTMNALKFPV